MKLPSTKISGKAVAVIAGTGFTVLVTPNTLAAWKAMPEPLTLALVRAHVNAGDVGVVQRRDGAQPVLLTQWDKVFEKTFEKQWDKSLPS